METLSDDPFKSGVQASTFVAFDVRVLLLYSFRYHSTNSPRKARLNLPRPIRAGQAVVPPSAHKDRIGISVAAWCEREPLGPPVTSVRLLVHLREREPRLFKKVKAAIDSHDRPQRKLRGFP